MAFRFATMAPSLYGPISDDDNYDHEEMHTDDPFANDPAPAAKNPATEITEWTMLVKLVTSNADNDVNIVQLH